MLEELEPAELDPVLFDVAAGGADELEDVEDEPPPQPATRMAPTASASASHLLGENQVIVIDLAPCSSRSRVRYSRRSARGFSNTTCPGRQFIFASDGEDVRERQLLPRVE